MKRGFVARPKEGMKKGNGRESKWDLKQEIDGHAEGQRRKCRAPIPKVSGSWEREVSEGQMLHCTSTAILVEQFISQANFLRISS